MPTYSHTRAPRTAVLFPHLEHCYPSQALLCPQQQHSPSLPSSIFQRAHRCPWYGEVKPEEHMQNGQREPSSLSGAVGVQIGLMLVQQWSQSRTVSASRLAGQGRGNMLKWEKGTESTSLNGERNSLPSHNSPGLLQRVLGKDVTFCRAHPSRGALLFHNSYSLKAD